MFKINFSLLDILNSGYLSNNRCSSSPRMLQTCDENAADIKALLVLSENSCYPNGVMKAYVPREKRGLADVLQDSG